MNTFDRGFTDAMLQMLEQIEENLESVFDDDGNAVYARQVKKIREQRLRIAEKAAIDVD